jgi:aspartate/methionine/tyrosine aminotransferase
MSAEREPLSSTGRSVGMRSPFVRLAELLAGVNPGKAPINLSVGEPQHPIPAFVGPVIAAYVREFGRYPAAKGVESFRRAASLWMSRRYGLSRAPDPDRDVLVLNGTREGLFLAALAARRWVGPRSGRPAILMPNPFYAAYLAGAEAAGCEPVFLAANRESGFLPDLNALAPELLSRTVALYVASPANPQGSIASLDYLARLSEFARRFGFVAFSDECYSEIYSGEAPPGMLQAAGPGFENVVVFQSLSKRSNLPGLRVGFAAGDRRFLAHFLEMRNVAAPQVPVPAQEVAAAALSDELHVEENRRLYAQKFDLADEIIAGRYGYSRPAGGFYLWLDVARHGGGEAAAAKLWSGAGVRVLPGRYIARDQLDGFNPGADYIRVAMVHDLESTAEALRRIVAVLG